MSLRSLLACVTFCALVGACASSDNSTTSNTSAVCSATPVSACPDPPTVYADVAPIFATRCGDCHAGTPGGPWPLTDYEDIADWQEEIRDQLLSCTMPPNAASMSDPERQAILSWIRCGTPR